MNGNEINTPRHTHRSLWAFAMLMCLFLCNCSYLERAARNATRGAVSGIVNPESADSLKMLADSVARAFSEGAIEGFTSPKSDSSFKALADSIARAFSEGAIEGFTSPKSKESLKALIDSLARAFGEGAILGVASGRARDALQVTIDSLGATLTRRVIALRDSLFPVGTRRSIDTIAHNLAELTKPGQAEETLSFIKESAEEILGTAIGGLVLLALIIGFFVLRSRRNRSMLDLVTKEIDNMSETQKERLTKRIQDKAMKTGLEPHLRKALEERRG